VNPGSLEPAESAALLSAARTSSSGRLSREGPAVSDRSALRGKHLSLLANSCLYSSQDVVKAVRLSAICRRREIWTAARWVVRGVPGIGSRLIGGTTGRTVQ
jgi:hypothetical protein